MRLRNALLKIYPFVWLYRTLFRAYYSFYMRRQPSVIDVGDYKIGIGSDLGMKKSYLSKGYFSFYEGMLKKYVREGDTVFDVGAHVGVTSALLSQRVGSGGRVVAFEPYPANFALLKHNVQNNSLKNVTLQQVALSCQKGSARFFMNSVHTGYNSLNRTNAADYLKRDDDVQSIEVQTRTIDDFLDEFPDLRPSFMKIDCQGAEYEILKGASAFFSKAVDRDVFIYLEFWPMAIQNLSGISAVEFLKFIDSKGFCIEYSEDFGHLVQSGAIAEENRKPFVDLVGSKETGYTNLMISHKMVNGRTAVADDPV